MPRLLILAVPAAVAIPAAVSVITTALTAALVILSVAAVAEVAVFAALMRASGPTWRPAAAVSPRVRRAVAAAAARRAVEAPKQQPVYVITDLEEPCPAPNPAR